MYDAPIYVWALVLTAAIALPASAVWLLQRGALASGSSRGAGRTLALNAAALLAGWLFVSAWLAGSGAYADAPGRTVPWFAVAFLGILATLLLATTVPVVARALSGPGSLVRLTLPHTVRVAGIAFLIAMFQGALPWEFAVPAALGDIATGIAAPFVARRLSSGAGLGRATWFNVFGLFDLVLALAIGALGGLGPLYPFDIIPTTDALAGLPLALVPTVAVPVAITLHVVALRQLVAIARTRRPLGMVAGGAVRRA